MSPARLLLLAPAGAVLVRRPRGATHVYVGPLTPSGCVPSARRAVCRTRTRRLYHTAPEPASRGLGRVCRRCVAALTPRGAATHSPVTRREWVAAYAELTPFDLAIDAWLAETADEVDRVRFLALLLVGWPAVAKTPVVSPWGRVTGPLMVHLERARIRVGQLNDRTTEHQAHEAAETALVEARERRARAAARAAMKS